MANTHRGEIEAEIGGARRTLVLTLGALAELESAFGADDLVALLPLFEGFPIELRSRQKRRQRRALMASVVIDMRADHLQQSVHRQIRRPAGGHQVMLETTRGRPD